MWACGQRADSIEGERRGEGKEREREAHLSRGDPTQETVESQVERQANREAGSLDGPP